VGEQWYNVSAVFLAPFMWDEGRDYSHLPKQVFFSIPECWDGAGKNTGSALFPQILKNELKPIERVVEAFSNKTPLTGRGTANGLSFRNGVPITVRVKTRLGTAMYRIDRWD
jgi:hypothetical protein